MRSHQMNSRLCSIFALGFLASAVSAQDQPDLANRRQLTSYALGIDIVTTLKRQNVDVDTKALAAGIADMLAGQPALTPDQQKAAMDDLSKEMAAKAEMQKKVAALNSLKDGRDFLAANARKPGVQVMAVTAPDGSSAELQYLILQSGAGPSPQKDDLVDVRYVGSLIDGTVFDTSARHTSAATISLDKVIPGWSAALQKMKAGDKWRLFIPPALGYGSLGFLKIPPNSTIIFDVELLGFHPAHGATNAPPKH